MKFIRKLFNYFKPKVQILSSTTQPASSPTITPFNYQLNDATTPNLIIPLNYPCTTPANLKFSVQGINSNQTAVQNQAINTYLTVSNSLIYVQASVSKWRSLLQHWAATPVLHVIPRAGASFNANYDRQNLKFFFGVDTTNNQTVYAADSSDIVAHELGHAILDILRPDLWNTVSTEIWAFHESAADINALTYIMSYDVALQAALTETNGDITQTNVISRLAEQFGKAVSDVMPNDGYNPAFLRNAVNTFTYVNPSLLASDGQDNTLTSEPHNFSRVFTGAWYDILCGIYQYQIGQGAAQLDAFRTARDTTYSYFTKALKTAPSSTRFYNSVATSMLAVDAAAGGTYQTVMTNAFNNRNILLPIITLLSSKKWEDVRMELLKNDEVMKHLNGMAVCYHREKTIKLSDFNAGHTVKIYSIDDHDLSNVELTVPSDTYYEFDKNNNLIKEIKPNEEQAVIDAHRCIAYLHRKNAVGSADNAGWHVAENKLARKFIECSCHGV